MRPSLPCSGRRRSRRGSSPVRAPPERSRRAAGAGPPGSRRRAPRPGAERLLLRLRPARKPSGPTLIPSTGVVRAPRAPPKGASRRRPGRRRDRASRAIRSAATHPGRPSACAVLASKTTSRPRRLRAPARGTRPGAGPARTILATIPIAGTRLPGAGTLHGTQFTRNPGRRFHVDPHHPDAGGGTPDSRRAAIGEGMTPSLADRSRAESPISGRPALGRADRTMPPRGDLPRPASNCGLTRTTTRAPGRQQRDDAPAARAGRR